MQLKRLDLTYFRRFDHITLEFKPGMNLLVGINGAGKSTILDALRLVLSHTLPQITPSRKYDLPLDVNDIAIGQNAYTVQLDFSIHERTFEHLLHLPREEFIVNAAAEGQVREQTVPLPEHNILRSTDQRVDQKFWQFLRKRLNQPFGLYFSTRRSVPIMGQQERKKLVGAGGIATAYSDALISRELRLREFADWWLVQETLQFEEEEEQNIRRLDVLNQAITTFLDNCTNFRVVREEKDKVALLIDKGGITLDVRQLSDGERNMIALVLDLARRLNQANPFVTDPLREGKAIVLIDELDLHLHPRWQRTIPDQLTRTFQSCQFIATTHSPQIIGEVPPENVILLEDGQAYRPDQSIGMDTNWILNHLMGVAERDTKTLFALKTIETLIDTEEYDQALENIANLRSKLGDFPELVGLQTQIDMIRFLDDEEETLEDNNAEEY